MSLLIHQIIAILFLIVIPLPIIALMKVRSETPLYSARTWKVLVMLANIALFVSLITGFMIYPIFTSFRVWFSVALILIIGAFLGIFSKQLKLYMNENNEEMKPKYLKKISKVGFAYIAVTIITFAFMSNWYNF